MSLSFCPKCSNILIPERTKEGGFVEKCSFCGYSKEHLDKPVVTEEEIQKKKTGTKIIKDENEFATYHHKCQKCGYDKAQIIDIGVFYSDENNLILLKCGKCGWSERVGGKVT